MTHSDKLNICWGRKENHANGKWIKLARGDDKAAIKSRLDEGFELCFCSIGSHPKSRGYSTGHPWYYYVGAPVLYPKEILEEARKSVTVYRGYMTEDIKALDKRNEPQRSEALRKLRGEVVEKLHLDISRYRELARKLAEYRKRQPPIPAGVSACNDIHTNISLKHNHIYNEFAHLVFIDELLSVQQDLFG